MNIKKQIVTTIATLALGAALIGGGTFAYFSDSATSNGNTFATGTIKFGTNELQPVSFSNQKPGDSQTFTYELKNDGTLNMSHNYLSFNYTNSDEENDLGTQLAVTNVKFGNSNINISAADSNNDNIVTLNEFANFISTNPNAIDLGSLLTGESKSLDVTVNFIETNSPQNQYQGDSVTLNFSVEARN